MTPHKYTIDYLKKNTAKIRLLLSNHGIVFFRDVDSITKGIDVAHCFGHIVQNIDANTHGITKISETNAGKNERNSLAFSQHELYPHTDRSPIVTPPKYLFNWVQTPAPNGGNSLFVDGKKLHTLLSTHHPKYLTLLEKEIATFTDNITSFKGAIFSQNTEGNITIRFRNDSCVLFDSVALPAIDILKNLIAQETQSFHLNANEAYLLDNTRWLHGRAAYQGHRVIYRLHINPS